MERTNPINELGLTREEANSRRSSGWRVAIRRQSRAIVRVFKDALYGGSDAALAMARAYRDALLETIPPKTNRECAATLRSHNTSGISGVRRFENKTGAFWQATLMRETGQMTKVFSIGEYGEDNAKRLAVAQKQAWLDQLPGKFLTSNPVTNAIALSQFPERLSQGIEVTGARRISDLEFDDLINRIDMRFDASRPRWLRVRVRKYGDGLSLFVSNRGSPARSKLVRIHLNKEARSGELSEVLAKTRRRIRLMIVELHGQKVAASFFEVYGSLLDIPQFHVGQGLLLTLIVSDL